MRKLFLTLAMTLIAAVSYAYDVEVDGIYYNLNTEAKTAEVTSGSSKYSGNVVIPESIQFKGIEHPVTKIGDSAFLKCTGLTSVTIGNSVTIIGDSAFLNCTGLTTVTIGNSVTSIGDYAFRGCYGLTSVTIGNSVTSIGDYAFYYCKSLTSVTIPNSVTSIGEYAFGYCSGLTSVTIPNSVKSIGDWAFGFCSGLVDVYCFAENVPETSDYAFYGTDWYGSGIAGAVLHVPAVALEDYKATEPWSSFGSIVPLTDQEMDVKAPFADSSAPVVVFDLQGHRLAQPQKGLNIINGKTVLVK